jgi:hypothetical protein
VKAESKIMSEISMDLADNLTALLEDQRRYSKILSEAKNLNKSGQFEESNKTLDFLFKMDLTQFSYIKEEANQIKIENENAITNVEIAKANADAKAKEQAVLTAKAAVAKASDPMTRGPRCKRKFEQQFYNAGYVDTKESSPYNCISINQGYYEVWAQMDGEYR